MSHKVAGNVAVLSFPFASHPFSVLRFVRSISTLAPDMQFTFFNTSWSNSSLFSGSGNKGYHNIRPYSIWDGMPDGYTPSSAGYPPLKQVELFVDTAPVSFEKAIKEAEVETGHKFDLLISDAILSWFASDLAEKMHVTWVPFWASFQRPLLAHVEIDTIKEKMGAKGQEDRTLDFLPGFSNEFQASDLPGVLTFGDKEPEPVARIFQEIGRKLPQAIAVAINCFETMDLEVTEALKKRLKKLFFVGPQHLFVPSAGSENDDGYLQWLDKQEPASVVYIGFGTAGALPPMEVAALAEALEERGFPFLWSFRGNQDEFPQGFIERTNRLSMGKVVPWVNQEKVLNHSSVGVFITHGGSSSILESITGGVPMIGRPSFADQNMCMRILEVVWRIGVWIEGGVFTKTAAVKALEQVLSLEQGKEMRQRVGILKHLAQEAVGLNGRSTQDFKALVDIIKP